MSRSSINRNLAIKLTAKQGGICNLCGRNLSEANEVHIDHIIPKSIGGADTEENLQAVCGPCNLRKGNTPPLQWSPVENSASASAYDMKTDPFVRRFFDAGLTPMRISHPWEAEAAKRAMAGLPKLHLLSGDGFPGPAMVPWRTWFWRNDLVKEWLAMPAVQPGVRLALHRSVGIGVHLFEHKLDAKQPSGFQLIPDDGAALTVLLMVIRQDSSAGALCIGPTPGDPEQGRYVWFESHHDIQNIAANGTALLAACLVDVQEAKAPRAMRRQEARTSKRSRTPLDDTSVYTVTYRKLSQIRGEADGGKTAPRDKYWWVRGHFRNQPYPSEGVVRPLFIHPHIQGNPDAPLYVRPRVNVVRR